VARPGSTPAEWDAVGIPELNLELARLWHLSFGATLNGCLPCPQCGARLEFGMSVQEVIRELEAQSAEPTLGWTLGDDTFSMRMANSLDLAAASSEADLVKARRVLLERCIEVNGNPATDAGASAALRESEFLAETNFERLHRAAEVTCQVHCFDCGHYEAVDLDLPRFLWAKVRHGAGRLLHDVHELASTYGWSEDAILGMSEHRRAGYLEMVRS
jgi:hypothetical protein